MIRRTRKFRFSVGSVTYIGVFVAIISFLALSYKGEGVSPQPGTAVASRATTKPSTSSKTDKVSVDQLTAASTVATIAETTSLPVAGELREATTTLYIKKQLAQTDAEVITKPQIIQPTTSAERGIKSYTTKEGDSLDSIAKQFNISAQTLRWANNTTSDAVEVGRILVVPLTDGVVYTIKDGDTIDKIAEKYKVDAERIVLYNDIDTELPLAKDTKIVLPNGDLPETERPGYVAPRPAYSSYNSNVSGISYGYARITAGNRYAAGNCTWYAYERRAALGRPVGSLWGNAYSWATSARAGGYSVNSTPAVGAVFQTSYGGGGYGHVGVVERVEPDGRVFVSDMNYSGYNVVTHRELPNPGSYQYIH